MNALDRSRYFVVLIALLTLVGVLLGPELMKMKGFTSPIEKDNKLVAVEKGDADTRQEEEEWQEEDGRQIQPPLLDPGRTILCFGDSLTFGSNRQSVRPSPLDPHPYAIRVAEILGRPLVQSNGKGALKEENFGAETVVENGWPGETALSMEGRLPGALKSARYPGLVIILGGTNDITKLRNAQSIVRNLQNLHHIALNSTSMAAKGGKPVNTIHMTIPPASEFIDRKNKGRYGDNRLQVNEEMRKFIRAHNHDMRVLKGEVGSIFLIDLEYLYLPIDSHKSMWNDDLLHFSADGYDGIADLVHKALTVFKIIDEKGKAA